MEPPVREEHTRMTKTTLFWLALLVLGNLLAYLLADSPASPADATAPADPYQQSLTLLDELSVPERERLLDEREKLRVDEAPKAADAEPETAMVCRAWGPYSDPGQMDALKTQLETLDGAVEVRSSEMQGEPDFLVFIDTGNNEDTARRTLQELETQSVDAYIIAGGPYVNSVSVGVFSRAERAENQRQRVAALGYKSAVVELSRSQTVYHLIARVPDDLDQLEDPGRDCRTIASIQ